jgi:hypothetical protein
VLIMQPKKRAQGKNRDLLEIDARDDRLERGLLGYWKIEQMSKQFHFASLASLASLPGS